MKSAGNKNSNFFYQPEAQDQSPFAQTQASSRMTNSKKSNLKQRDSILTKSTQKTPPQNETIDTPCKQLSAPTTTGKRNVIKKTRARETQRTHGPGEKVLPEQ